MTRPGLGRVVAVLVATLLGGGTAYAAMAARQAGEYAVGHAPLPQGSSPTIVSSPPSNAPVPSSPPSSAPVPSISPMLAAPTRLVIDRLGIDMAVVPQGVDGAGQMALPEDPDEVGWYRYGPAPASDEGAMVLAAHIDSRLAGVGPFARLTAAHVGDEVVVRAGEGAEWRYRVEAVQRLDKTTLDYAELFARSGAPRLHLVTCTGRYERDRGYESNLVVIAQRLPG